MPYYCELCESTHANGYKKHLKYKSKPLVSKKDELADLEKVIEDIREIKRIMSLWAIFIQRKHPYWNITEEFIEWINDV